MTKSARADITGVVHRHLLQPYQEFATGDDDLLAIASGSGIRLTDSNGVEYIDAIGGMWCTNIGTGREEMAEAIAAQVRRLSYTNPFSDMAGVPAAELAERLAGIAPDGLDHVFFTTGGSTAIDAAFRMVQFYHRSNGQPQRVHVLSREDAYHGSTYAAVSIGGKKSDHTPQFHYIDDIVHHLSSPNFYRHGGDLTEDEFADRLVAEFDAKVTELGAENVAAFFAEPIMASGGVVPPPANYLRRIWERCRRHGILYVSDEVVTAFGRVGEWFCSERIYGITPDIITTAKGLTSGYLPLGAVIYSDHVHTVISEPGHKRVFGVGYTYSGHPVSCAAALENIAIIEREGLLEHVRELGPLFMARLEELADGAFVGDVRGSHLMACVEFVADKATKAPFPDHVDIGKLVAHEAQRRGLIVRPIGNLNVMSPALVIDEKDIDDMVARLGAAIDAAAQVVGETIGLNERHVG